MSAVTDDNDKPVLTNKSAHLVKNVREKFLEEYEMAKDQFDELDVKKVMQNDWFVKRFLIARHRNEKNALRMLISTLKWRKEQNLRYVNPQDYPEEFYSVGAFFPYENDKEGNATMFIRIKFILKIPEMAQEYKNFGTYLAYRIDEDTDGNGITAVIDFKNCGMQNADLDLLRYSVTNLIRYCPAGLQKILVVDLPMVFRAFWLAIRTVIPAKRRNLIHMVTRETITDFIDVDSLPKFLGGTCKRPYRGKEVVPVGCPTAIEFGVQRGYSVERFTEIKNTYQPLIDDID